VGLLSEEPELVPGDRVRWNQSAGYSVGPTFMGGHLYITETELIYVKGRLGGTIGNWGDPPRFPLSEIVGIDVMERTLTPYDGGMRRRVRIQRDGGVEYLFIVKHPDDVAAELRHVLGISDEVSWLKTLGVDPSSCAEHQMKAGPG
jgi:hypothetical protein